MTATSKQSKTRAPDLSPSRTPILPANIPSELTARPQWVCYKLVHNPTNPAKPKKVPYNPTTGQAASVSDRATWATFDACYAAYQELRFDGVGYVFTADDPYTFIDYDDCVADDGTIRPDVQEALDGFQSYSEYSQSGRGIHIIGRA